MVQTDWWTRFKETGRVLDYLSYKGIYLEDEILVRKKELGEGAFESDGNCDRDDIVCNTYR